jgi:hypothetical protein
MNAPVKNKKLFFLRIDNRTIFIIFCILIGFLCIDTVINSVIDFLAPNLVSRWALVLFVTIAIVYGLGSYSLLRFIHEKTKEVRRKTQYLKNVHTMVILAQLVLSAILVIVLAQVVLGSAYYTVSLVITSLSTNIVAITISLLFAKTFFSWYRSNKKSFIVLFYGLAFGINALSLAEVMALEVHDLSSKQPLITPGSKVVFESDYYVPNSILDIISNNYQYTTTATFILIYVATMLLLYHYIEQFGRFKFWTLMLLPLLYNLSTLIKTLGIYTPQTDSEQFIFYVYSSLNSTAGGILFGIAFWEIAKSIRRDSAVRDYMVIAAYGLILFFISNQVGVSTAAYPPFGIATYCLLGLSSYMVFLGLYSSAISVSQSIQLRRSIEESIKGDSNLLSSIGTAEMQEQVLRKVDGLKDVVEESEREMRARSGIESSIPKEDILTYLEEALQEVGKSKKTK